MVSNEGMKASYHKDKTGDKLFTKVYTITTLSKTPFHHSSWNIKERPEDFGSYHIHVLCFHSLSSSVIASLSA